MSKVQSLVLGDQRLDLVPSLTLGGIAQQVHDDRSSADGLLDGEQGLSLDPTVLLGLFPGFTALSDTDDDLQAVVTGVEGLAVALGTVTDHGEGVILEVPAGDAKRDRAERKVINQPSSSPMRRIPFLLPSSQITLWLVPAEAFESWYKKYGTHSVNFSVGQSARS